MVIYTAEQVSYTFTSDGGVFSKKEVDFGSRVLIEAFEEPEMDGDFLDAGCGYGPIGLSLAGAFTDRTVHMIDVNERAVELSNENAEKKRNKKRFEFIRVIYFQILILLKHLLRYY